jgi:hypothetical protein
MGRITMKEWLSEKEKQEFIDWALENYKPFSKISPLWHPIIQSECKRINDECEKVLNNYYMG